MKNNFSMDFLYIAGTGKNFGSGHYKRGKIIIELLRNNGYKCDLVENQAADDNTYFNYKTILLDKRDDSFPKSVKNKKKKQFLVTLDNRGSGRSEADLFIDTLPHIHMNQNEIAQSLKHCILPPQITREICRSKFAKITLINDAQLRILDNNVFIHRPHSANMHPDKTNDEEFRLALIKNDIVATYFGQTLFEAIYLGKQIYLYSISPYHSQLAEKFLSVCDKEQLQDLDGKGAERVAALIIKASIG